MLHIYTYTDILILCNSKHDIKSYKCNCFHHLMLSYFVAQQEVSKILSKKYLLSIKLIMYLFSSQYKNKKGERQKRLDDTTQKQFLNTWKKGEHY